MDNPLTRAVRRDQVFGPQKGIAEDRLPAVDALLEQLAAATDRRTALAKGAGAAGGLGFALLLLGADPRARASTWSPRPSGCPTGPGAADLVVTGEGAFDFSSPLRQGARTASPTVAAEALRPCVALAGQVLVGSREMRALGVESAYSMVDLVGEERALRRPGRQPGRARRADRPHLVALTGPAGAWHGSGEYPVVCDH